MYDDYMNTEETANFLGVKRHTVEKWRKNGILMPDVIGHGKNGRGGVYYYSKERILQLASVYVKNDNCNRTATSQAGISDSGKFSGARTILENLPAELLNQKRFFPVRLVTDKKGKINKVPVIKAWQKPENQMTAYEAAFEHEKATGLVGMDICGHGLNPDFFFVDFDHVKDQSGNFLYEDAERWSNYLELAETFSERSISKDGLHYLFCPTANKFPELEGTCTNPAHAIYFDETKKGEGAPKIELFHCSGRYILLTGDSVTNMEIVSGEIADEYCQQLCNQLALDISEIKDTADACAVAPIDSDISVEEVKKMLDVIPCAKVTYFDWFKTAAIIHYHFGEAGFELWRHWSETDPKRYTLANCQKQWSYITKRSADRVKSPATIGSLIFFAKKFGYHPPKKSITIAADDNANMTQDFIPNCPINLKIPNNFIFDAGGIARYVPPKKDKDEPKYIPVSRTPIIVTKIFTETKEYSTQYEIAFLLGKTWRHITVDGKITSDPRYMHEIANKGALIEEPSTLAKFFARLIAANYDALPKVKAYTQPGWHGDKFIYPVPAPTDDYICKCGGFNYSLEFATNGNADVWKATFLDACQKGGAKARIAFGNVFASSLVRPLNVPNIQCQLDGKSGGGKTALLKFAASAFGNPRELVRTFGATLKNRQAVAAAYNDLPTFLDELGTLQGGKKGADTLPQMVYEFEQGKANQAQKRDGTARETFKFYGSRTMTGEFSILKSNDPRGVHKRVVPLDCGEKIFDDEFATELHIIAENHFGHFGRQWTKYVESHLEAIRESYLGFTEYIYREKKVNIEPTLLKAITVNAIAYQHFRIAIGEQETFDFVAAAKDIKAIISTLPTPDELDDSTRAIKDLQSFVAGHINFFAFDIKDNTPEGFTSINSKSFECYGKRFGNGEIAFLPHALKKILEEELHYQSADALIAEFAQKGYLRCGKGKGAGLCITTRIYNQVTRSYRFKAGVLSNGDTEKDCEESIDA